MDSDWKQRFESINRLAVLVESYPDDILTKTVKIFDCFCPRLNDANSKVSLNALNTLNSMIPLLKVKPPIVLSLRQDGIIPVLGTLIPTLAGNLSSTKPEIRSAAVTATHSLIINVDNCSLLPFFTGKVHYSCSQ